MNYDANRPANKGDTKLSELAVDRQLPLFDSSAPQQNALVAQEVAFSAITEIARKQNYILRSEGLMQWTGGEIRFDANALINSINLEILATEGTLNSTFQLRLQGSTTSNGLTQFLNIPMADGDLIYMELESNLLVDTGASFNLGNAVNGGYLSYGMRVLKMPMTTALPKLQIGSSGSGSLFHIPLAIRRGTDIWWIPHGIMWPAGTTSTLGAIIVQGFNAYPNRFVNSQAELLTALTDLSGIGGGVALVTTSFAIDQTIVVPPNVKLLGRHLANTITLNPGGMLQLSALASVEELQFVTSAAWTGSVIYVTSNAMVRISRCYFNLSASANLGTVIGMNFGASASLGRIKDSAFIGVNGTNRIGVNYNATATGCANVDCYFG